MKFQQAPSSDAVETGTNEAALAPEYSSLGAPFRGGGVGDGMLLMRNYSCWLVVWNMTFIFPS